MMKSYYVSLFVETYNHSNVLSCIVSHEPPTQSNFMHFRESCLSSLALHNNKEISAKIISWQELPEE